jgi:cell division protein FtsQ
VVTAVLGWLVLFSPVLAARDITVVGADRIAPEQVRDQLDGVVGTPLARLAPGRLASDVRRLPLVKEAEVVRVWPHTVEVRLVERTPIAAVPAGPAFELLDAEGHHVATVPSPPTDVPLVQVDVATSGVPALQAASDVAAVLPADLRADVEQILAGSRDDVRLRLRGGAQVVWGSAADSEVKAAVLQALRAEPAKVYDVSAPLTPVTR